MLFTTVLTALLAPALTVSAYRGSRDRQTTTTSSSATARPTPVWGPAGVASPPWPSVGGNDFPWPSAGGPIPPWPSAGAAGLPRPPAGGVIPSWPPSGGPKPPGTPAGGSGSQRPPVGGGGPPRPPAGGVPTSRPTPPHSSTSSSITSSTVYVSSTSSSVSTSTASSTSSTSSSPPYPTHGSCHYKLLPFCTANSTEPCNGGEVCLRNADAFPMLLQEAHNFSSFNFIACSGANTSDCDASQVHSSGYGSPDLVTITIGGDNNQAFLGLIVNCVYQRDETYCQYAIQNAWLTVSQLPSDLKTLFTDIKTTNAAGLYDRRVAVVGYPKLWSTTNSTACQQPVLAQVPMAERQAMNNLADAVNGVLKQATEAMGFGWSFVDADSNFHGKRLCDNVAEPLFQYDFATALYGVFHPTAAGQELLYKAVEKSIGCA
ncbi:Lipase 1 [Cyphellophora attinorum]|uniref:Lipase 1 n=1 Tax=Cyphellophora attinorum TaxID=1664694 RepID=A0A0N1H5V6_9EURO|nr:Lipase 1 [Phialophora attinorum]KPI37276.1 Lipase 1 [Phialophora attinorum]